MRLYPDAEVTMTESGKGGSRHDPGDSVPPGVAPEDPAPLSEEEREVKRKLEELGEGSGDPPPRRGEPQGRAEPEGPEKKGA
ncbi:hypothetical protein [Roseomonas xinghualingensis]|uniref:hypothetical protein n=1 Tax=Roseomonas xinghualingensis TaxID=2986475 RepID=UPI0021F1FDD7|nr:hypothetical protein [Roseomonas sp. SXEYE001]MCV4208572.1 hypothetical protein [Roseomonas sp. SXEYE001]